MLYDVTELRRAGLRLPRSEWPKPLRGTLRFTELGPHNVLKRTLLCADLWENFGTTSQRGLAHMSDPVILPYDGDGLLIAGIELQSEGAKKIWEHRQVWLCVPVTG